MTIKMQWYYILVVLGTIGPISGAEHSRHKRQSAVSPRQRGCPPAACPADCSRQFFNDPQTGCISCRCDPNDNSNPFVFGGQFGIATPAPPITTGQGSTCTPGDTYTDKCNSCFCPPSGVPVCTLQDCTNAPPGPACRPGDNWTQGCNRCTCLNNQPVCTFKGCPTGRPVCNPNTPCPLDCPAGTVVTTDSQTGCQKCICRLTLGRPTPVERCTEGQSKRSDDGCNTCKCTNGFYSCTRRACPPNQAGICNSNPPCPLDCPNGASFVTNPQTGCRTCTCSASTGIGGGPIPSLVCNPNPPCPSDCATEFVLEPLTRCRSCRCQSGSPTIARPQPDRCTPPKCPRNCITAIVQNPQNGCNICACNTNFPNNPFAPPPTVTACPPTRCPADCITETIRDPSTGCQTCRCNPNVTQINPFAPPPSPVNACQPYQCPADCTPQINRNPITGCETCTCATGFNSISFGNPFAG